MRCKQHLHTNTMSAKLITSHTPCNPDNNKERKKSYSCFKFASKLTSTRSAPKGMWIICKTVEISFISNHIKVREFCSVLWCWCLSLFLVILDKSYYRNSLVNQIKHIASFTSWNMTYPIKIVSFLMVMLLLTECDVHYTMQLFKFQCVFHQFEYVICPHRK